MILDDITNKTSERLKKLKSELSLEYIKKKALSLEIKDTFSFENSLKENSLSYICEIKKASPSKGNIVSEENFDVIKIAKEYEVGGASAISILTEPYFFKGNNGYLTEVSKNVNIPILRKDFIIDEYMIYESKIMGADAILLICSILDKKTLKKYINLAHSIGLSVLVEVHDKNEIKIAIEAGARIIGVNNRNLKTFEVNFNNALNLRKKVPKDIIFVSESGIKTKEDIDLLKDNNVDAVLIGEFLMKSQDKAKMIKYLDGMGVW